MEFIEKEVEPWTINFGGKNEVEIFFDTTFKKKESKDPWGGEHRMQPRIMMGKKELFVGTEIRVDGCGNARRGSNMKMTQEAFDWMIKNIIY